MAKKMYVSFVLDETGSMMSCRDETISGFNEFIQTLKNNKKADSTRFTLTKFNSCSVEIVYDAVKLSKVKELNEKTYVPDCNTPLFDAIGSTIRAVEKAVEDKKRNVMIVIQTDGQENSSTEYTQDAIRTLIEKKDKEDKWTFAFLGADQNAYLTGGLLGISKGNTMSYAGAVTASAFRGMSGAVAQSASMGLEHTSQLFTDLPDYTIVPDGDDDDDDDVLSITPTS